MCVCVCVYTPRNRVKMDTRGTQFLNSFWTDRRPLMKTSCFRSLSNVQFEFWIFSRGTWRTIRDHVQRSYLIVRDTGPDQLCVPAFKDQFWTFDKLLHYVVFQQFSMNSRRTPDDLPTNSRWLPDSNTLNFRAFSTSFWTIFVEVLNNFQPIFDQISTNFRPLSDQFSIKFRSIFDQFSNYDLHFDELHLAYVGQCYFTMVMLIEAYLMPFPYLELHQTTMKTIISVCRPPGATSSRLDGPSEKVQTSKHELMLPAGVRAAIEPRFQGRTAGQGAVGDLMINANSKTKLSSWRRETFSLMIGLVPTLTICLEGLGWTGFFAVEFSQKSCIWISIWFRIWFAHGLLLNLTLNPNLILTWIRLCFWFETDAVTCLSCFAFGFVDGFILKCSWTWQWLFWHCDSSLTSTRLHLKSTGVADLTFQDFTFFLTYRIDKYRFFTLQHFFLTFRYVVRFITHNTSVLQKPWSLEKKIPGTFKQKITTVRIHSPPLWSCLGPESWLLCYVVSDAECFGIRVCMHFWSQRGMSLSIYGYSSWSFAKIAVTADKKTCKDEKYSTCQKTCSLHALAIAGCHQTCMFASFWGVATHNLCVQTPGEKYIQCIYNTVEYVFPLLGKRWFPQQGPPPPQKKKLICFLPCSTHSIWETFGGDVVWIYRVLNTRN